MTRAEQLRARLLGFRPTDRFWGWFWPILLMVLGGILRFWALGRPHQLIFDETYYVKQGVSMLDYGVEMRVPTSLKSPDALFTHGTPNVFTTEGDLVVHPPFGKWMIAAGEWMFGQTSSFGWRFAVALVGTLSILMIGRAARRMFGSTLLGACASFILAFEGHHFVMSRTGILDIMVMFWALAGFCALLIDRDHLRERLADRVGELPIGVWPTWGPWVGGRPWRWMAGICLGLCCGTKWSGIYFLAAFGIMAVWWDIGARRAAGVRRWGRTALLLDGPFAAVSMLLTSLVVYLLTWTGWFLTKNGYDRHWAVQHPSQEYGWIPASLRSLWHYHQEMYRVAISITQPHPYELNPWGWTVQARPTSFFYESPKKGVDGCTVAQCSKAITSLGTVSMWWLATAALVVVAYYWIVRRDWRAGAIAAGFVGGWLPWFQYQARTIFGFYAVAFEPYAVLACVFVLGLVLGSRSDSPQRRRIGLVAVGCFLGLELALFAFFWPIYTAQVIPFSHWQWRMWFPSWV